MHTQKRTAEDNSILQFNAKTQVEENKAKTLEFNDEILFRVRCFSIKDYDKVW